MRFDNTKKPNVIPNGDGTQSARFMTGHGAKAPAQEDKGTGMRRFDRDRLMPGKTLKKLSGSQPYAGQGRFVRPIDSATAIIPPQGLGNPRGERSMD